METEQLYPSKFGFFLARNNAPFSEKYCDKYKIDGVCADNGEVIPAYLERGALIKVCLFGKKYTVIYEHFQPYACL